MNKTHDNLSTGIAPVFDEKENISRSPPGALFVNNNLKDQNGNLIELFMGTQRFPPALIQRQSRQIKQLPVRHVGRMDGKTTGSSGDRPKKPFKDDFAYRWIKKRYSNYEITANNLLAEAWNGQTKSQPVNIFTN